MEMIDGLFYALALAGLAPRLVRDRDGCRERVGLFGLGLL